MARDTGRAAADVAGVERSPDEGERLQQVTEYLGAGHKIPDLKSVIWMKLVPVPLSGVW
jgi:hypothetical protein